MFMQSKPLDLGVSDRNRIINSSSPKRKSSLNDPIALDVKKKRSLSQATAQNEKDTSLLTVPNSIEKCRRISINSLEQQTLDTSIAVPNTKINSNVVVASTKAHTINSTERDSMLSSNSSKPIDIDGISTYSNSKNSDIAAGKCSHNNNNNINNNNNNIKINVIEGIDSRCSTENGIEYSAKELNEQVLNTATSITQTTLTTTTTTQQNPLRTNSADGLLRSSSTNSSPAPSPQSAPATPAKFPIECEKPSSPGKNRIIE